MLQILYWTFVKQSMRVTLILSLDFVCSSSSNTEYVRFAVDRNVIQTFGHGFSQTARDAGTFDNHTKFDAVGLWFTGWD